MKAFMRGYFIMSRIFISHSSKNDHDALALKHWLEVIGWAGNHDVFLDIHSDHGVSAGFLTQSNVGKIKSWPAPSTWANELCMKLPAMPSEREIGLKLEQPFQTLCPNWSAP